MFGNSGLLTPVSLWANFDSSEPLQPTKVGEVRYDNIVYCEYYFSGRTTGSGRVRIYGLYVSPDDDEKRSALLYIPEITEKMSYDTINEYAKLGYSVLAVDLYGSRSGGSENCTVYPEDVNYANFEKRGRRMDFVDDSARETCWYEWVAVCKYALKFLRELPSVDKIGVIGVKNGATIAWHLAATESDLALAVMLFSAGWTAYRGIPKYADKDIEMDEERRKFIAAIDAHAYAQYVKCPILYLTATNNEKFDFDRANDTLVRINPSVEYFFNFAPTFNEYLDEYCKKDVEIFLDRYFGNSFSEFAAAPTLTAEQDGSYLSVNLSFASPQSVASCKVYINEGVSEPAIRNWQSCPMKGEVDYKSGNAEFEYVVNGNPEQVFIFAVVRYKDGSSVSSKLVRKKIGGIPPKRANLVYSSINGLDGITFYDKDADYNDLFVKTEDCIYLVAGGDGIYGAYSPYGIISYKFGEPCCKADENSIIQFDVFSSEYCLMKVVILTKNENGIREFSYSKEIEAGKVWKNVTIFLTEFKSAEGMSIKNFDEIFALRIESDSKYAVNNILLI